MEEKLRVNVQSLSLQLDSWSASFHSLLGSLPFSAKDFHPEKNYLTNELNSYEIVKENDMNGRNCSSKKTEGRVSTDNIVARCQNLYEKVQGLLEETNELQHALTVRSAVRSKNLSSSFTHKIDIGSKSNPYLEKNAKKIEDSSSKNGRHSPSKLSPKMLALLGKYSSCHPATDENIANQIDAKNKGSENQHDLCIDEIKNSKPISAGLTGLQLQDSSDDDSILQEVLSEVQAGHCDIISKYGLPDPSEENTMELKAQVIHHSRGKKNVTYGLSSPLQMEDLPEADDTFNPNNVFAGVQTKAGDDGLEHAISVALADYKIKNQTVHVENSRNGGTNSESTTSELRTRPVFRPVAEPSYHNLPSFIRSQLPLDVLNESYHVLYTTVVNRSSSGEQVGFCRSDLDSIGGIPHGKGKVLLNALAKLGLVQLKVVYGSGATYFFR